jgi:hypothetical protein
MSQNQVLKCTNQRIGGSDLLATATVGAIRFGIVNTPQFEVSAIPTIRIVHIPHIFSKYLVAFQVIIAFVQDQLMLSSND